MLSPSPAIRAALIGLVLVTLTVLAATGVHIRKLETQAEAALIREVQARSATLAAALVTVGDAEAVRRAFEPIAQADWPMTVALISGGGGVEASSDPDLAGSVGWAQMIGSGITTSEVHLGREGYIVALHPVGRSGRYVVSMTASEGAEASREAVWETALWAAAFWGLSLGCLLVMGWYAGPYTASRLEQLGARIAEGDADPDVLIRHARLSLGHMASIFGPTSRAMTKAWASVASAREHIRALYQVNPHYVLFCTLDGRIIEANPAFYAVTGLSLEALKAGPVEVLDDIFPVGPLQDMARRSLKEACSIGGIEYGIIGQDDEPRAVEVSLRAFALDGEDVVMIQATDVSARRTMEKRIHAFTDTLDLMVDRRVAQLTAGQKSIRRVLDAAGLVLASFDAGGATRRWSGGARGLTGRSVGQVPHFSAVTSSLEMTEANRSAFTAWFWADDPAPFVARHAIAREGGARTCRFVWHKSAAIDRDDLRTIIGLELPPDPSETSRRPVAQREVEPIAPVAGDGLKGAVPLPDSAFGRLDDL